MTRGAWGMVSLALAMLPVAGARAEPFTLDDHFRLVSLSEPVFSPAADRIVYVVSRNDPDRDDSSTDLWSVAWTGGKPRQLTRTPDRSESRPRFSADGRSLYFLSDGGTDAVMQLWRMPASGGRARQVTDVAGGVSDFDLAPNGRQAVIVAEVGGRVGASGDTPPPIETERFVFKWDGKGYLDDRTQQLFIVDLATGRTRPLTRGLRDHGAPAWSPDGTMIAFTAKDRGDSDRDSNYEIYVQRVDSIEARRISTAPGPDNDPEWSARPAWSPDSARLLWLEGGESRWIYYATPRLAIADIARGEITRPANIDRWFYYPRFAPDGSIVTLIEQDRDTWLARIDPGGRIEYLTSGRRFASDFAVAPDGRIAVLDGDVATPAELFALDGARRLTHHHEWLGQRDLGEVRDLSFMSGEIEIHGYLTLPPGFDAAKRNPLLVYLHGGPVYQHSHEFDLTPRLLAAAGYAVLSVNPRGSSGRGFEFSRAIHADWGNLDVQDISAGITHAIDTGIADPRRIGVFGWSYGGILTDYMIASDPRIRAAVSGAGVANVLATFGIDMYTREYLYELGAPWENFETWRKLAYPFLNPERITAPTLFLCAGDDDNVPCAGAQQMYLALKIRGVPTRLIVYPGQNHGLDVPSYLVHRLRSHLEWFDRWLR